MSDLTGRKGAKRARRAQEQQETQIQRQRQIELARLAEEDEELARGKAFRKLAGGGRSLLAKAPATGGAQSLGGS